MTRLFSAVALCVFVLAAPTAEAGFRSDGSAAPLNDTMALQMRLADLGYFTGAADGALGPITHAALSRFQRDHGLFPSGKANAETRAMLFSAQAAYGVPYPYAMPAATPVAYAVPAPVAEIVPAAQWPSPSASRALGASQVSYMYTPSSVNVVTGQPMQGGSIAYVSYGAAPLYAPGVR